MAAFGLLTAEVVRVPLVEGGGEVGSFAHEAVVDEHPVGDGREPAGDSVLEAHQADEVGAVAMEGQGDAAELVAAGGRVVGRLGLVGDVAEHVAVLVLRPR